MISYPSSNNSHFDFNLTFVKEELSITLINAIKDQIICLKYKIRNVYT